MSIGSSLAIAVPPDKQERRIRLAEFYRMRVDGPFTVRVRPGPVSASRIVGDDLAIAMVRVRVEGRTLAVLPARDDRGRLVARTAGGLVIELCADRPIAVTVRGAAMVRVERIAATRFHIAAPGDGAIVIDAGVVNATLMGSSALSIAGRDGEGRFLVDGPGTADAGTSAVDTLPPRCEARGGARYHARHTADVTAIGPGAVTVGGTPRCRTKGTATIRCG